MPSPTAFGCRLGRRPVTPSPTRGLPDRRPRARTLADMLAGGPGASSTRWTARPPPALRTTAPCITPPGPGQDARQDATSTTQGAAMRLRASTTDARHEDILELEPMLRRVVGARVRNPDTVDDLVQEALARVIAVRGRLDDEAVAPYAIVTARNLVTSLAREEERGQRHRPRLVDPSEPERREAPARRNAEAAAVEAALAGLPDHEREVVVAHEVEGVDTTTLAEARRSTPGAVGTQLARTRARLRLDYLLALRRGGL